MSTRKPQQDFEPGGQAADFQKIQLQLAHHLRDPEHRPPPPGLEQRRLQIYRRLFFNNIKNFISQTFPVLKKIYAEEQWLALIRSFYSNHESHSPYFADISKAFVDYLRQEHQQKLCDPPFLSELAHYEWIEFALSIAEDVPRPQNLDPAANLSQTRPILSPHAWQLTYQWEVHKISPSYQPSEPGTTPTHIILCRHQDYSIHFMLANPMTHQLLTCIQENPQYTGLECISATLKATQTPVNKAAIQGGENLLRTLRDKEVLLGGCTPAVTS